MFRGYKMTSTYLHQGLNQILAEMHQDLHLIAGPCAVEDSDQIHKIAQKLAGAGIRFLRGGAYKPRTSRDSLQGIGIKGYQYLHQAARANNMYCISEVLSEKHIEEAFEYIDILQVGARNMQNYSLLRALGQIQKPVLLKRNLCATYEELIKASEYISSEGNHQILLCERGIRTFERYTRNTLDVVAVPVLKSQCHYPIIVDPSHATGRRELVIPAICAAIAAGANGIMVEVHFDPDASLSDANQALGIDDFIQAIPKFKALHQIMAS